MKKATIDDLRNLKHGDKIHRLDHGWHLRRLLFVSEMPKHKNYLIFCDGEYLTHLYLTKDNSFAGDWYIGEWTEEFSRDLKIKYHERQIESIKNRSYII